MVERLKDKPFTLLGINSDSSRSALKKILKDENITWQNIYGGPTNDNPIAKQWNVYGWPTIYILDHEGVIRYKGLRGEAMEKAVNELLKKVPPSADAAETSAGTKRAGKTGMSRRSKPFSSEFPALAIWTEDLGGGEERLSLAVWPNGRVVFGKSGLLGFRLHEGMIQKRTRR